MTEMRVAAITIYPIKSLDGQAVDQAYAGESAGLEWDRRYALVDADDKIITAKREPRLQTIRTRFDVSAGKVAMTCGEAAGEWRIVEQQSAIETFLSELLGQPIRLRENEAGGFPDDTEASGPTVVGSATLEKIRSWFPSLSLDEVRRRFRCNIEVATSAPFEEDGWLAPLGEAYANLKVGEALLQLVRPCQRCAVPTRDALSGKVDSGFSAEFSRQRGDVAVQVDPQYFDHFYRCTINTLVAGSGVIRAGDAVSHVV